MLVPVPITGDTMNSITIIQHALKTLNCSQKELAERLGVSAAQVSKWKKGEAISAGNREKLDLLLGLENDMLSATSLGLFGSKDVAMKWLRVLKELRETSIDGSETQWNSVEFDEDCSFFSFVDELLSKLAEIGYPIPQYFPTNLELPDGVESHIDLDEEEAPRYHEVLFNNTFVSDLSTLFEDFLNVEAYCLAFVEQYDCEDDLYEAAQKLTFSLPSLVIAKSVGLFKGNSDFERFRAETIRRVNGEIINFKEILFKRGHPIQHDIGILTKASAESLGRLAEGEAFRSWFNPEGHPDYFLNAMHQRLKVINSVLDLVRVKLGITDEEVLEHVKNEVD